MADTVYRKELLSPSGKTVVSTSERETNDLVYGQGYRVVKPEDAPTPAANKPEAAGPKPPAPTPKETP